MKQAPELIWLALPLLAAVGLCSCRLINPLIGAAIPVLACPAARPSSTRARHARQFIRF
jgi:hypothetical protein